MKDVKKGQGVNFEIKWWHWLIFAVFVFAIVISLFF